ncbi:MAG: hypothetical protein WCC73_08600, partial [Terracidiphilus sp.]
TFPFVAILFSSGIEFAFRDLGLGRATQFAGASASTIAIVAPASTAAYLPKIKVDVIEPRPSA